MIILAVASVCVLSAGLVVRWLLMPPEQTPQTPGVLSYDPEEIAWVWEKYQSELHRFKIAIEAATREQLLEHGPPSIIGVFHWGSYRVARVTGPVEMDFETQNRRLCRFDNHIADSPSAPPLKITKAEAETLVWKILDHVYYGARPRNMRLVRLSESIRWHGSCWRAVVVPTYEGYDSWHGMTVTFLEDGTLLLFEDWFQPVKCPLSVKVSETDALRVAKAELARIMKLSESLRGLQLDTQVFYQEPWCRAGRRYEGHTYISIMPKVDMLDDPEDIDVFLHRYAAPVPERLVYNFRFLVTGSVDGSKIVEVYVDATTGRYWGCSF